MDKSDVYNEVKRYVYRFDTIAKRVEEIEKCRHVYFHIPNIQEAVIALLTIT